MLTTGGRSRGRWLCGNQSGFTRSSTSRAESSASRQRSPSTLSHTTTGGHRLPTQASLHTRMAWSTTSSSATSWQRLSASLCSYGAVTVGRRWTRALRVATGVTSAARPSPSSTLRGIRAAWRRPRRPRCPGSRSGAGAGSASTAGLALRASSTSARPAGLCPSAGGGTTASSRASEWGTLPSAWGRAASQPWCAGTTPRSQSGGQLAIGRWKAWLRVCLPVVIATWPLCQRRWIGTGDTARER
mmetsp:Transcript_15155/g.47592  ORF Transcript_15155/g.47592 Transcript_15155/m.47592 type:complete len:244 (+) Transcript_15155:368-1099(+)